MADNIVPIQKTQLPASLAQAFGVDSNADELSGGIQASFAVLSFRGSVWRIKYKSEETIIRNGEGDPVRSIKLVMLKAAPNLSKIFYAKDYEEGDDSAPDCFSLDGIRPDKDSPSPQCATCAACPQNIWGSKITPAGNKTKACSDNKRIAVVPTGDLDNTAFGGPMLLRIPPASLGELDVYSSKLQTVGVPYALAETKISFDTDASFPKLQFTCASVINDEATGQKILAVRNDPQVERILQVAEEHAAPPAASQPTPAPAQAAAAPVVVEPASVEPEPAVAAPAAAVSTSEPEAKKSVATEAPTAGKDIDALVGSLLAAD